MRINCPWCGERAETEFRSAGAALDRPSAPTELDGTQWADHIYGRDNQPGLVRELWWHWAGCRQWLLIDRDSVSHRIDRVDRVQP
jgi:heterotetrameric sarcosine oxidase delta subunit